MQKSAIVVFAVFGSAIVALLAALLYQNGRVHAEPELNTPFHGVLLTNGQAFIGRLEKADTAFPVLREVYYVRSQTNPDTKQVVNTLVKRGQEWHAPDAMILNASHIVLIEPVKPDSQMGKLIEENRKTAGTLPPQK
jgi:hypothetical protein